MMVSRSKHETGVMVKKKIPNALSLYTITRKKNFFFLILFNVTFYLIFLSVSFYFFFYFYYKLFLPFLSLLLTPPFNFLSSFFLNLFYFFLSQQNFSFIEIYSFLLSFTVLTFLFLSS